MAAKSKPPRKRPMAPNRARPSPAEVREFLSYAKSTGVLRWKKRPSQGTQAGDVAGSYHPKGYFQVGFKGQSWGAHVLAFVIVVGRWPKYEIDHRDGDGTNNRWRNLREATTSQNGRNRTRGANRNSTTGLRGVYPTAHGKFIARVLLNCGTHKTPEQAQRAIERARRMFHGSFYRPDPNQAGAR